MQNIVIAIITIIVVSIIVYAIGRITIIISDCILVKQHNKQTRIIDTIQQALKQRHSAFDYGLMGFITIFALAVATLMLWILGGAILKLV
jgi:hypothetical protein